MKHLRGFKELLESSQELTQEQRDWLDRWISGTWKVNPQTGLVDVRGSFECSSLLRGLTDFKGVRFGSVSGHFNCSKNSLTSLEGAPQSVGGSFDCSINELKSLEGAPQSVGGSFDCSSNKLKSLEGLPDGFSAGTDFDCSNNELKSLKGLPDVFKVNGYFDCSRNELTSLEGAPQSVGGAFYCSINELKSLEGAPQSVGGGFYCSSNKLESLKGLPDGFSADRSFSCHNNPISERAIKGVVQRMGDKKIPLEQAVAEYWKWIPQEDRAYLAKHHPSLPEDEKRGYEAMGRLKRRII